MMRAKCSCGVQFDHSGAIPTKRVGEGLFHWDAIEQVWCGPITLSPQRNEEEAARHRARAAICKVKAKIEP